VEPPTGEPPLPLSVCGLDPLTLCVWSRPLPCVCVVWEGGKLLPGAQELPPRGEPPTGEPLCPCVWGLAPHPSSPSPPPRLAPFNARCSHCTSCVLSSVCPVCAVLPWRRCRDNICHTVVAPAPGVPERIQQRAKEVAELAVGSLAGAGVFGVELFLLPNDEVRHWRWYAFPWRERGHRWTDRMNVGRCTSGRRACGACGRWGVNGGTQAIIKERTAEAQGCSGGCARG